ncbi:MAG: hypothetical protein WCH99_07705 [Verrucomicrobiota bacterium]
MMTSPLANPPRKRGPANCSRLFLKPRLKAGKSKPWLALAVLALSLLIPAPAKSGTNTILWGVNIHDGGNNPHLLADKLAERNLKSVRMDLWGNDPRYLAKFRNAVTALKAKGIAVQAVLFVSFSRGGKRHQDISADLKEVEQSAYQQTLTQVHAAKDLVRDYELQNETSLYPGIQADGSTGQKTGDFDSPEGRLQAASLRGMSRAINEVRKSSRLPLRIILGTVSRHWGFLAFMQQQGVLFDVVGYHIYPHLKHPPLDQNPWFGPGGPLGQLARFNKPITINEFNAGEIYNGTTNGANRHPGPSYLNQAGNEATEDGFKSLDKHLKEIVNQNTVTVESVLFYEIWDEPRKAPPENRFGLFYDFALQKPKISLLIATSMAGGTLTPAEQSELTARGAGLPAARGDKIRRQ